LSELDKPICAGSYAGCGQGPEALALSLGKLADVLGLPICDLATGAAVHLKTISMHSDAPRLKAHVRGLVRVLSVVAVIAGDIPQAAFWLRNVPIPAFNHKTAYTVACKGRVDDLVGCLATIESGLWAAVNMNERCLNDLNRPLIDRNPTYHGFSALVTVDHSVP
jgi:hypothetical protein